MAEQSSHLSPNLSGDSAIVDDGPQGAMGLPTPDKPGTPNDTNGGYDTGSSFAAGGELIEAPGPLVSPEQQKTVISRTRPQQGSSAAPPPFNPVEMAVVLEGQRLGHFELGSFVGGGGMGAVFRAVDTMLDRTVAVKILSRNHTDEEIIRRFKNEAQSAARLDHPNIARVYYVGEDQGWNYIVFEFIEGVNIRDLVEKQGPLSLEEAFSYTLQIAEALEHASSRDVVHRDIKPSNVLVMPDGRAKLVDMGLARLHQVEAADNDLTASGVTLGTFDYISPEQARDPRSADVRSDLYSLGCTLYYMLTGRPPFAGTAIKKLLSHAGETPPDIRQFRSDVPDEVVALVNKMMAKRPEDRFQRPSELIGEMLLLANQLGLSEATRGGTVWITRESSWWERFAPAVVTAVSLLALIVAVLAADRLMSTDEAPVDAVARPQLQAPLPPPPPPQPADQIPSGGASTDTVEAPVVPPMPRPDETPAAALGSSDEPKLKGGPPVPPALPAANAVAEIVGPADANGLSAAGDEKAAAEVTIRPKVDEIGFLTGSDEESSASLSAAVPTATTTVPKPLPEVLVVGADKDELLPDSTIGLDSLEQALKYASETPTVKTIELAAGTYELEPLKIAVHRPEEQNEKLTIRARGVVAPLLVFRPRTDEVDFETRMIRIVGGRNIRWEGVHFWLELPQEIGGDHWSLFDAQNLASLTFSNCTMTIQNAGADGRPVHQHAAFLEIEPPVLGSGELFGPGPLFVELANCIARGEASLVRAEVATPFGVYWDQGLFVSSERMVEVGGRSDEPHEGDRVEIDLRHVTAVLPKGLCRLSTEMDKKYQLILDVNSDHNIFIAGTTDPLLERQGPEKPGDVLKKKLLFNETESFYDSQAPVLCRVGSDLGETREYRFMDAAGVFMQVEPPKTSVMWNADPGSGLPHNREAQQFELSDHQVARTAGAGFALDKLPALPAPPKLLSRTVVMPPPPSEDLISD